MITRALCQPTGSGAPARPWPWLLLLLAVTALAAQMPPAGTRLENRARATYVDPDTGDTIRLDSNPVAVVVQPLESLALVQDQTVRAAIGTIVQLPHRLTNTGNVVSHYALRVENLPDDDGDLAMLRIVWDVNGNGLADAGEPVIRAGDLPRLAPGESLDLVILGNYQSGIREGQSIRISIVAETQLQHLTASNTDTVIASGISRVELLKSVSPERPGPGEQATYALTVRANGSSVAARPTPVEVDGQSRPLIWVVDDIPTNTQFVSLTEPGNGVALYHLLGTPADRYQSAVPDDLTQIDRVGYGLPELAPGASFTVHFTVRIAAHAAGDITNTATVRFQDPQTNQPLTTVSNRVTVPLECVPPEIDFFVDGTFTVRTGISQTGLPLYCQVIKGMGNLQPDVIDTIQVELTSTLTGDVEVFTATETGPNTGIFRVLPEIPTTNVSRAPHDGVLETMINDVILTRTASCEGGTAEARLRLSPTNVIYDSVSNAPLAGVRIILIDVTGASNGGRPGEPAVVLAADGVTPAPNEQVTGPDGTFSFPWLPPGTYRIEVVPAEGYTFASQVAPDQQPADRVVDAAGSYGLEFVVVDGDNTVRFDVPLDAPPPTGLFVQKVASRNVAEVGEFLDYRVTIRNTNLAAATQVVITDRLPAGFAYEAGTARVDGGAAPDPTVAAGGVMTFRLPDIASQSEVNLTYRVRITAGAQIGEQTNAASVVAQSVYGPLTSNTATAVVQIQGGVFTDRGVLIGMVYVDLNGNRRLDPDEPGVPGVRIWLEDGTFAITDGEGRYSLYGLRPGTRVAKVDALTLPVGAVLQPLTHRHGDSGDSRFIDLKNGEMHKANFALAPPEEETLREVEARRTAAASPAAPDLDRQMSADGVQASPGDTRGRPSTGLLSTDEGSSSLPGTSALPPLPALTDTPTAAVRPAASVPLEEALGDASAAVGFIDLVDGDTLPLAQVNVRIKGAMGAALVLRVNGEPVADKRIGRQIDVPERHLTAVEYIGVALNAGPNELTVAQFDDFGNERQTRTITVTAPGRPGRLVLTMPEGKLPADGQSRVPVVIEVVDDQGARVSARTAVTIVSSAGVWETDDLDGLEPGLQLFVEGGRAEVALVSPEKAAVAQVQAVSGLMEVEGELVFVPHLRPLTGVGVVEGKFTLRGTQGGDLFRRPFDPFEDELQAWATRDGDGNAQAAARAALFFKGRVLGDWLLTMGYDSEKETNERLMRDIQPDEFYPVYGDSSTKGYDAQSTGRLYARLDKGQSYLLYGDYTTRGSTPARSLGAYYRSLTGFQGHWQAGMADVDFFASHDNARQMIEEFPARGTSGPFLLGIAPIRENSEQVEILVRDRNQPSLILSTRPQVRFTDYEIEPLTGRIIFRLPIPTLDPDYNPVSVRVSYEVEQAGQQFWTYGLEGTLRLARNLELGGSWIQDENPIDPTRLRSLNFAWNLDQSTSLIAELAETRRAGLGVGQGARFEFAHRGPRLSAQVYAGSTDANFDNPSAMLNRGRREMGIKAAYLLDAKTRLSAEALRTEDVTTNEKLEGLEIKAERALTDKLQLDLGVRHAKGSIAATVPGATGETATKFTTVRARLTGQIPGTPEASVYGEYEQDVTQWDNRVVALGGDLRINNRTRLYARHELLSSIGGRYLMSDDRTQNSTIFGIDSEYTRDAHLFSEYRSFDGLSGRETEAAVGLRNRWQLARGVALHTGFENIRGLEGRADRDSTSVTAAVEYTRDPRWLGSARVEYRNASNTNSFLSTLGLARRLSNDWTFLGKYLYSGMRYDAAGSRTQQRLRLGLAYRDTRRDFLNGLLRYEFLTDRDSTMADLSSARRVHIASADLGFQLSRRTELRSRYALKHVTDRSNQLDSRLTTQLVGGRITHDIGNRFDVGLTGNALFGGGGSRWGVGLEGGYLLTRDLWLSAGYNWSGFRDDDLIADAYTDQGPYFRFRFKFDEGLFR